MQTIFSKIVNFLKKHLAMYTNHSHTNIVSSRSVHVETCLYEKYSNIHPQPPHHPATGVDRSDTNTCS